MSRRRSRAYAALRRARGPLALLALSLACAATPLRAAPPGHAPRHEPPSGSTALRATPVPAALLQAVRGSGLAPDSVPTIYLITFGPGDAVWERFGHDAIWVHDPVNHTDIAYNWGMFDFNAPHFWSRFILGTMEYWMQGLPTDFMVNDYVAMNRSVWVQELNFTPAQARAMQSFLLWNALPQNRYYRYDYYLDNCTTRARDAINRIIGGAMRRQTSGVPSGTTYRSHSLELTAGEPFVYTGIELGLGEPTDREISVWAEMFLPMQLMEHVRDVTLPGPHGPEPLVKAERTIFLAHRAPLPTVPPTRWPWYLLLGLAVAGAMIGAGAGVSWADARAMDAQARPGARATGLAARLTLLGLGMLWSLLAGAAGVVLDFLWIFTAHWGAHHNENVLQVSPLSLILLVLIPFALLGRRRGARSARRLAWLIAALSAAGFVLQVLPSWNQFNGDIIAFVLPVDIGLALGLWLAGRHGPAAPDAAEARAAARVAA